MADDYIRRIPPQNLNAEKSVLGGVLLEEKAIHEVVPVVEPGDFYMMHHGIIFSAMAELSRENKPIDLVTLSDALKRMGNLEDVGGLAYLTSLADDVPTAANIQHYAKIIREKSVARKTITFCRAAIEDLYRLKSNEDHIRNQLCAKLIEMGVGEKGAKHIGKIIVEEISDIEKRIKTGPGYPGFNTGFVQLNLVLGGIQRKQLFIIGARPSVGKTAFALNMIVDLAKEARVLFFSNDQSGGEFVRRLLSRYGDIVNTRIRDARLGMQEYEKINKAGDKLYRLPIWINDSRGLTIDDIGAQIKHFRQKEQIDVVIIDYLQLINRPRINDNAEIEKITGTLKELAGDLDIAVILLSQLNRDPTKRSDGKPQMYDLRGSGAAEQDANVVLLLHRDITKPEKSRIMEVIIAKHKDGPLGTMICDYEAKTFLIEALKMEGNYYGE